LRAALARGGDVAQAAQERLGPAVAAIDQAVGLQQAAREEEAVSWAAVLAEDARADAGIGSVRDAMWNALGRPRQSPYLEHVFPGGLTTYTSGDPTGQPVLMQVLRSRLLSASAPQWPKEKCEAWAAEIDALREPYQAAVDAHRPTDAAATVADVGYRSAVRTGQARLAAFKRDLQNLGLTEPQIHELIPDVSAGAAASSLRPTDTNGGQTAARPPGA
jgi:hypothetical protein